jgi:two-component system, cell cycle response regulator
VRILIADDDPTSRLIARAAVQRLGHHCDVVRDGNEAWEFFQANRPDVILSDWMMPGLTGIELCQNIRADGGAGYTYVILLTSQGARGQILAGMSAGADEYLVKPLDPDELGARLLAAARVTALHQQLASQHAELRKLNRELSVLARQDALTGLRNRRVLEEDLALLDLQADRYGPRYCIALLDIDHFKAYNDSHGHPAGDSVLQAVGARLNEQSRGGDNLYRYGGEEFLCILPEQGLDTGLVAVERMRLGVERLQIPHEVSSHGVVTLSAGVAAADRDRASCGVDVLKEADDALYRAKALGRNRAESTIEDGRVQQAG